MSKSTATVAVVIRVARRLREVALRASQDDAATLPISPAELAVVEVLARADEPVAITVLSRTTGLAQSWVSKLVSGFAASGVVILSENPADRRQTLVRLSDEVRSQVFDDAAERSIDGALEALLPRMTATDRTRVEALIVELDRLLRAHDHRAPGTPG